MQWKQFFMILDCSVIILATGEEASLLSKALTELLDMPKELLAVSWWVAEQQNVGGAAVSFPLLGRWSDQIFCQETKKAG